MIEVRIDEVFATPLTVEEQAKADQLELNQVSLQYLKETDWYVTRFAETGVAIPTDIVTKRTEARLAIVV